MEFLSKFGTAAQKFPDIYQLRLVHVRRSFEGVSLNENRELVIAQRDKDYKPFDNTVHFTLNAVVRPHTYGTHFAQCHAVVIAPLVQTVALGNIPQGLLPADTYFHRDRGGCIKIAGAVLLAPDNMPIPDELSDIVQRYPHGLTDEETELFKIRAAREVFNLQNVPFYDVGNDDWAQERDPDRPAKIWAALGLPGDAQLGRHDGAAADVFASSMTSYHRILSEAAKGARSVDWGPYEISVGDAISRARSDLENFLQKREVAGSPPEALQFYSGKIAKFFEDSEPFCSPVSARIRPLPPAVS